MIDATTLLAYGAVVLGLLLVPGPAVLLTLARATAGGRPIGFATGLGIVTGDAVHAAMAIFGLSAILMTSALAFNVVKFAGVAYLVFLGLRALFARGEPLALPSTGGLGASRAFRQAILAELLNPKTALFFLAFLPQFIRPESGPVVLQLALFGVIFCLMSGIYISLIALLAGSLRRWLMQHRRIGRWQGKAIGTVYLGLGVRLALQHR